MSRCAYGSSGYLNEEARQCDARRRRRQDREERAESILREAREVLFPHDLQYQEAYRSR